MTRREDRDRRIIPYTYCGTNGVAGPCVWNNGNVLSQIISAPNSSGTMVQMTQNYNYDRLNRVTQINETPTGTGWTQAYCYDAYGNRAVLAGGPLAGASNETPQATSCTAPMPYDGGNHWAGAQWDGNGDQWVVNGSTMTYDAENRLTQVTGGGSPVAFTYDGLGRRVTKTVGANTTTFVYDAMGQMAAEYGSTETSPCTTCYLTVDPLGSTRLVTAVGGAVTGRHDDLPFGEEIPTTWGLRSSIPGYAAFDQGDGVRLEFTGKERDLETGLDYFGARYFSSAQGRFTSPDEISSSVGGAYEVGGTRSVEPRPLPYADITNPQSLNKYAYGLNNPLRYVDPDGHCVWDLCIGEGAAVYAVGAAVVTTAAYLMTPQGQDSARAAIVGSGLLINKAADALGSLIFSESRPGTLGKPDHQQTVEDEAKRVNGDTEVPIPTPGGAKQGRRADAVGTNPDTGASEIVQVYRPTPAGNIPKREKQAAADIQGATGVEPTMVPVRPLPPPKPPCTPTDGGDCK